LGREKKDCKEGARQRHTLYSKRDIKSALDPDS
jgi:hypothetical protein